MRRPSAVCCAVLLSLACAFAPVRAQQHPNVAQGFNPSGSFAAGDVDNVNLFNGNLVIRIPLGQSYPVNGGLSYGLTLVYNSQVWEHQLYGGTVQSLPFRTSNAGLGWTLSLGRLNPPYTPGDFETVRDTYMSPDGARDTFYPTLHEGETATSDVFYSRDGTYLRYKKSLNQVEFPDGTVHTFDASGFLTRIEDPFHNAVNVCTNCCAGGTCTAADPWRITDAHGREHWVYFRNTGYPYQPVVVDRVEMDSFGSQPAAVYTFHYNIDSGPPLAVKGCHNQDPATQSIPVVLLTSLTLPDGSSYGMPDYFNTPTGLCKTGMIHKLVLPTLGSLEYDYIEYHYPSGSTGRSFWQFTAGVGTRTLRDELGTAAGTWTYSTALQTVTVPAVPKELVNSVTDPLGHRVVRYFAVGSATSTEKSEYGLPFSRQQAGDGTGRFLSSQVFHQNGAQLRSTYLRYESDLGPTWATDIQDWTRLDQRQASQRTVFHDDGGKVADETLSDFDGHGHYRYRTLGGTFPGSNTRTFAVSYNPARGTYGQAGYSPWPAASPWVLGTYSFAWVLENGPLQSRTFCFDPATGFLLGRRIHVNSSTAATNDQVEIFSKDSAGNVTSERYFGGDTQAITADPTQGYVCNLVNSLTSPTYQIDHSYAFGVQATATTTVGGSTLFLLDQTIDRSTGLPSASRDTAGRQTSYSYDVLGRLTQIQPPQDAARTYTWRPATSASSMARVTVAQTLGGVTYTESRIDFDGFGRPVVEEERMPDDSWADRRTAYNALGWKTSVSDRDSPYATQFLDYDPFGRPGRILPPDSPGHVVTLTYAGTSQVVRQTKVATSATGESPATTTEVYDRQGRLFQVTEPNGVITRYEYDAGDHLKRVCQGFNPSNSTCGQERLFTFDNRGLLLWENHPEKTANNLGLGHDVDYLGYDARGHATRKVDGTNDLTYVYDKAERLTQIRQTGAGACGTVQGTGPLCLKSFTYATANGTATGGGTDYKRGKLVSASRYNYVGPPFNATAEIQETWQYAGRGGRMSQQDTALIFNGAPREAFRQTFTWNEIGDLSRQTYPDCSTPTLCGSAPRTQDYGYTKGRLTSVSGFAPTITYHPSGMVAQVAHSNGLTDIQSADPAGMARPAQIYTQRVSDGLNLWSTGFYSYDGSGNVWKTGNALYLYDTLSRVVSGKVYSGPFSGGTASTQAYTYDNYGNLTGTTTNGTLVNTPATTTTNRLTGGTYDAAGNLAGWSGNSYEYDAFDQMTRLVSSGEDWRYIYTAGDERFWSYRAVGGAGSVWTLRGPGGQVLREYTSNLGWGTYKDSIYRGSTLLAIAASPAAGGGVSHLHTDHLGTPRLITDAAGNPATKQYHAYYPYGQELAATYTTAYTDRQRFTGHERDLVNIAGQGDDLDYMHARHYSPVVGRFLSVDVVGGTTGNPQSWNRYAYVLGNPLRYVDPDGKQTCATTDCINVTVPPPPDDSVDLSGFYDFLEAGANFSAGFADATLSNFSFGLGRHSFSDGAFQNGQFAGDAFSFFAGLDEAFAGGEFWGIGTGFDLTVEGAAIGVPMQAVGTVMIIHGGTASALGFVHLMEANRKGGGKTGRKINEKREESLKKQMEELREKLAGAQTNAERRKIKQQIKHVQNQLTKSETHWRR